jgi:hypothetical protein
MREATALQKEKENNIGFIVHKIEDILLTEKNLEASFLGCIYFKYPIMSQYCRKVFR